MSNTKDEIQDKVRIFFRNIPWKKILTFSFFLLLSAAFWLIQVYRQKFEATIQIPIKYTNVPDSIVFDNELPQIIEANIKDDGAALFKYYFLKRNDSMEINIRQLIHESSNTVIQSATFGQMIRNKLFVSSELVSYSPSKIVYAYAVRQKKKIPVIYDGYINLPTGYIIDGDFSITPDSVIVYGNKQALDTIDFIHTVPDTLTNIISDSTFTTKLKQIKGLHYYPSKVKVSAPVDQFTTKEVSVPVTCLNLPSNLFIRFIPSNIKISFQVSLKRYKDINANNFLVAIDYDEIKGKNETSAQVRILQSPDYVRAMTPNPSEVEFILEQN